MNNVYVCGTEMVGTSMKTELPVNTDCHIGLHANIIKHRAN